MVSPEGSGIKRTKWSGVFPRGVFVPPTARSKREFFSDSHLENLVVKTNNSVGGPNTGPLQRPHNQTWAHWASSNSPVTVQGLPPQHWLLWRLCVGLCSVNYDSLSWPLFPGNLGVSSLLPYEFTSLLNLTRVVDIFSVCLAFSLLGWSDDF